MNTYTVNIFFTTGKMMKIQNVRAHKWEDQDGLNYFRVWSGNDVLVWNFTQLAGVNIVDQKIYD